METINIQPVTRPIQAAIRPPGSKSITNRALVCAALAKGTSTLVEALASEDTQWMSDGLRALGIQVESDASKTRITVHGCGGRLPVSEAELSVGNSGTTIRFLSAVVALGEGTYRLDGVPRMRERPIGDLADALQQLGAKVQCQSPRDCPPLVIHASGLRGGCATVRGEISSQFLSALLMAAPYADKDVEIQVEGPLVSVPYVQMTISVMREFGVTVDTADEALFLIPSDQPYQARRYPIEPDASAASYLWAAAAITGGRVTVEGLSQHSLQGDVAFCECLEKMGCQVIYGQDQVTVNGGALAGIEVDMKAISDTVQTLAAVALFADGPTTIRGVGHIRHKETDRIGNLAQELRRVGAQVTELDDGLRITPDQLRAAEIETYEDHRMAMSMALVGLKTPGISIRDPQCTAKTYPAFFDDLAKVTRQQ